MNDINDDLREISDQELVDLSALLTNEASEIKQQIATAKAEAYEGTYSDRDWWRRVNGALNVKQKRVRKIQAEFKRRKDQRRTEKTERNDRPARRKELVVDNVTKAFSNELTEDKLETYLNEGTGQLAALVPLNGDLIAVWVEYVEVEEGSGT